MTTSFQYLYGTGVRGIVIARVKMLGRRRTWSRAFGEGKSKSMMRTIHDADDVVRAAGSITAVERAAVCDCLSLMLGSFALRTGDGEQEAHRRCRREIKPVPRADGRADLSNFHKCVVPSPRWTTPSHIAVACGFSILYAYSTGWPSLGPLVGPLVSIR